MGSPLNPILTNIFFSHHEDNWLNKCPIEFKTSFYRRYVDDILAFWNIYPLNTITKTLPMNMRILARVRFSTSKIVVKTANRFLVFTESHYLMEFSPIMNFSFQRTKRGDFYTHYFIRVLAYVVI